MTEYEPDRDDQHMAHFIALNVCRFLYCASHEYRVECLSEGGVLRLSQQLQYEVRLASVQFQQARREGRDVSDFVDIQFARFCMKGYSCNVCRTEMTWYEYSHHMTFVCRASMRSRDSIMHCWRC